MNSEKLLLFKLAIIGAINMYNYEWDELTGGYILTTKITGIIKEVRPVFHEELKLLGFDKQFGWVIPECEYPLMWAEARRYFYKGRLVGEANGGSLYDPPSLKSYEDKLNISPVDIPSMIEKNKELMNGLVQKTLKFIYDTYKQYQNKKVDISYVAFSGGKDSIVLLDLVQRALPHDGFKVVFADTTMELSDTYVAVANAQKRWNDLDWYVASSHMDAMETWTKIGPPAEKLRWCCSVHKTAPQVLLIKNILNKSKFKTLVFIGVRAEESPARSSYDIISDSKKHIMQTSYCPIFEWNSSEVFLYMFENNLLINNAYRKGLTRAGCLFCPMSSKWSFMINGLINNEKAMEYVNLITNSLKFRFLSDKDKKRYFNERNWKLRLNGRDINNNQMKIFQTEKDNITTFTLIKPKSDWKVWISTIGEFIEVSENTYELEYNNFILKITTSETESETTISFQTPTKNKTTIRLMYLIKNAFNKSIYCVGCKVCMVECPIGALNISDDGKIRIKNCIHCENCLDRPKGCLVAQSLSVPKGGKTMGKRSIAGYQKRGLKQEWLELHFSMSKECLDFWKNEQMGVNMFKSFKTWAIESGLITKEGTNTELARKLIKLGSDNIQVWAVIFTNLVYESTLFNWFVKELSFFQAYDNDTLNILLGDEYTPSVKKSAIQSLKETIKSSPIGWALGQGECEMKGNSVVSITRYGWSNPEPLAILYSLYKFAEKSDRYYSFTLTDLIDNSQERVGISPTQLYNIEKEKLERIILSLSHDYNDFIKVAFNKDLDSIYLENQKTSLDVVDLIVDLVRGDI